MNYDVRLNSIHECMVRKQFKRFRKLAVTKKFSSPIVGNDQSSTFGSIVQASAPTRALSTAQPLTNTSNQATQQTQTINLRRAETILSRHPKIKTKLTLLLRVLLASPRYKSNNSSQTWYQAPKE